MQNFSRLTVHLWICSFKCARSDAERSTADMQQSVSCHLWIDAAMRLQTGLTSAQHK